MLHEPVGGRLQIQKGGHQHRVGLSRRAQCSGSIRCRHDDCFARNDFASELPGRVAQVKRDSARELRQNPHSLSLAGEKHVRALGADRERLRNRGDRKDGAGTVVERGSHRARRPQYVEDDTRGRAQIFPL